MYLTRLALTNFRCFERIDFDALDRLAVLVGENDAGKTVILDSIAVLVGAAVCGENDFRRDPNGEKADEVVIEGTFRLELHDTVPEEFRVGAAPGELRLRRRHTEASAEVYAWMTGFDDVDYDDFNGADRQKDLLRRAGANPASNEIGRREQFAELVETGKLSRTTVREVKLPNFAPLNPCMPRIERVASNEYRSPDAMIQRTLQAAATSVMTPLDPSTGRPKERPALRAMRARIVKRLNEEIEQAKSVLQRAHPKVKELTVVPNIDFSRSITTTSLTVNIGDGDRPLSGFGEGTKKRMWMGLMEWEQRVTKANVAGSVVRLYDEPDVNLHYEAQRQLFANISELAGDITLRTQCIVCTHAVTLVDRAPCESINLIQMEADGRRRLHRIGTGTSADAMSFFNEVGRAVGLSNTVLLYERGFLLVEGDCEEVSIPIIYRALFGRSMTEEGIVLVNLHTCSAWRSVVEVMLRNRLPLTQLLLDADCQEPESSARITATSLNELGCGATFLAEQVSFVGEKEFEDAFADVVIADALDADFARQDGTPWLVHVATIKTTTREGGKFSRELQRTIRLQCIPSRRSEATKPNIAAAIARRCRTADDVPPAILQAIQNIRIRAGMMPAPAAAVD